MADTFPQDLPPTTSFSNVLGFHCPSNDPDWEMPDSKGFSQDTEDCLLMSGDWSGMLTKSCNFLLQEEEQPMVTFSRANYWTRNEAAKAGFLPTYARNSAGPIPLPKKLASTSGKSLP